MEIEEGYFDPFREEHIRLIEEINRDLTATRTQKVAFVKFGDRTHHVFKDKKYFMSINWGLV